MRRYARAKASTSRRIRPAPYIRNEVSPLVQPAGIAQASSSFSGLDRRAAHLSKRVSNTAPQVRQACRGGDLVRVGKRRDRDPIGPEAQPLELPAGKPFADQASGQVFSHHLQCYARRDIVLDAVFQENQAHFAPAPGERRGEPQHRALRAAAGEVRHPPARISLRSQGFLHLRPYGFNADLAHGRLRAAVLRRARMVDRVAARSPERREQAAGRIAMVERHHGRIERAHDMRGAGVDADIQVELVHQRGALAQAEPAVEPGGAAGKALRELCDPVCREVAAEEQEVPAGQRAAMRSPSSTKRSSGQLGSLVGKLDT